MSGTYTLSPEPEPGRIDARPIIIQNVPPRGSWLGRFFGRGLLILSIIANFVLLGMYLTYYSNAFRNNERYKSGDMMAKDKIAVIKVHDMITTTSVQAPKRELEAAKKDDGVKAVILDIMSPGGTISGSDELYHAISEFRKSSGKPVVAAMKQIGTSGAYYIAMPANRVIADRTCITGSIGVIATLFDAQKLLDNIGVKINPIKSGGMKDSGAFYRPMTPEERKEWERLINAMYARFLAVITENRADKIPGGAAKLKELADGRVYYAEEAQKLGLIDEIGYSDDAIRVAKDLANLSGPVRVVQYARPVSFLELVESGGGGGQRGFDPNGLADVAAPKFFYLPASMAPLAPLVK